MMSPRNDLDSILSQDALPEQWSTEYPDYVPLSPQWRCTSTEPTKTAT